MALSFGQRLNSVFHTGAGQTPFMTDQIGCAAVKCFIKGT